MQINTPEHSDVTKKPFERGLFEQSFVTVFVMFTRKSDITLRGEF